MQCSLCSRAFARQDLRYNPVGGGVSRAGNEYLCQQCWQVLCGQPWPAAEDEGSGHGTTSQLPPTHSRPPVDARQQPQHPGLLRALSQPMSGICEQSAAVQLPSDNGRVHGGITGGQQGMFGRRSMSFAELQGQGIHPQGISISGMRPQAWHPSSMPEQPAVLGSADDPRWGVLACTGNQPRMRTPIGASAPVHASLLAGAPAFSPHEMRNLLDEQSLELFESQSHLLDPEAREAVQKQRQFLEWQQNSMEEPGPMSAALERQDSAGSGNEPHESSSMRRQLRALAADRDRQAARSNELCQQLQEKKRQLFTAIQEREQLKEQVRSLEGKLKEYHEVMHCKLCRQRPRNCVVLPCLHYLYCDDCFKAHCTASPSCPACHTAVSGFQTLMVLR